MKLKELKPGQIFYYKGFPFLLCKNKDKINGLCIDLVDYSEFLLNREDIEIDHVSPKTFVERIDETFNPN